MTTEGVGQEAAGQGQGKEGGSDPSSLVPTPTLIPAPVYVELGAGRGLLGFSVGCADPTATVLLVERDGSRKKADRTVRQQQGRDQYQLSQQQQSNQQQQGQQADATDVGAGAGAGTG
eukprot:CAMPEP_0173366824 /NCGR_PEP_ID=MMETSP1144-20121109/24485_1 /TAXON_ID=483371 /ORGANISM="non described non described, Strain CCMP2298" /LENGTH=117 /DNA_ID=CAMNT_0014317587 /DNA_START=46 /DNA_END=395 /DNA_ORIENTATION=-